MFKEIAKKIVDFPNCFLAKNIVDLNIDVEKLKLYPRLLDYMSKILSGHLDSQTVSLWRNSERAFFELWDAGFYHESIAIKKCYNDKVQWLDILADGGRKIKEKTLESICTVSMVKGQKTLCFDYHDLMTAMDKSYQIHTNDFFHDVYKEVRLELNKKYIGGSEEDLIEVSKMKPSESLSATKMSLINHFIYEETPFFSFWGRLVDKEFQDISNGSYAMMIFEPTDDRVYNAIKKIIKKELSTIFTKKGLKVPNEIKFYLYW